MYDHFVDSVDLSRNLASGEVPDMKLLFTSFVMLRKPAFETAPYFEGYCGEHVSEYPEGTQQLAGVIPYDAGLAKGSRKFIFALINT